MRKLNGIHNNSKEAKVKVATLLFGSSRDAGMAVSERLVWWWIRKRGGGYLCCGGFGRVLEDGRFERESNTFIVSGRKKLVARPPCSLPACLAGTCAAS